MLLGDARAIMIWIGSRGVLMDPMHEVNKVYIEYLHNSYMVFLDLWKRALHMKAMPPPPNSAAVYYRPPSAVYDDFGNMYFNNI